MLHPKLQAFFEDYAESHQHPVNRLTHKIAIPVIVFHILGMLDRVQIPGTEFTTMAGQPYGLSLGHLFILGTVAWFATMNVKLALIMLVVCLPVFPLGMAAGWPGLIAAAAVGWLIQLAGHAVWEKKSPAFLRNMKQALIGPLFFLAILTGDWKEGAGAQQPAAAA